MITWLRRHGRCRRRGLSGLLRAEIFSGGLETAS